MSRLVLSLFPGIGLLDRAFEEEGFTVVRGPDILWGSDARNFHPPADVFDGVIGGPPCQPFSNLAFLARAAGGQPKHDNLIPVFEHIVADASPTWFLMENVKGAPIPEVFGYNVVDVLVNNRWVGGIQDRLRRFSFGTPDGRPLVIEFEPLEQPEWVPTVTTSARATPERRVVRRGTGGTAPHEGPRLPLPEVLRRQGLPADFLKDCPFTVDAQRMMLGNGVPLPLGRAIARAVKWAFQEDSDDAFDGC